MIHGTPWLEILENFFIDTLVVITMLKNFIVQAIGMTIEGWKG